MVDTVLSRDKNWVRWKAEGCPPIERPQVSVAEYLGAREQATKTYANKRIRPSPMGSLDLKFLTEGESLGNLERLKESGRFVSLGHRSAWLTSSRFGTPAADSFMMGIVDDEFDMDTAQSKEGKENAGQAKASKTWRMLRLSARSKLNQFDKIEDGKNLKTLFESPPAPEETKTSADGENATGGQDHETGDGDKASTGEQTGGANYTAEGSEQALAT